MKFQRELATYLRQIQRSILQKERLIFLENVVDGSEHHSGDGNDRFLVPPAFFQGKVTVLDFGMLAAPANSQRTLYQKRFNVGSSSADSGGFLLSSAFVVLRCKTSPEIGRAHV